jgi:hypothetical protein
MLSTVTSSGVRLTGGSDVGRHLRSTSRMIMRRSVTPIAYSFTDIRPGLVA